MKPNNNIESDFSTLRGGEYLVLTLFNGNRYMGVFRCVEDDNEILITTNQKRMPKIYVDDVRYFMVD